MESRDFKQLLRITRFSVSMSAASDTYFARPRKETLQKSSAWAYGQAEVLMSEK